jgi:hypothetical protein
MVKPLSPLLLIIYPIAKILFFPRLLALYRRRVTTKTAKKRYPTPRSSNAPNNN